MKNIILAVLLAAAAGSASAAQISQADCNYAIERLKAFNSEANKHPGKRTTFEEKATYAYAEVCEGGRACHDLRLFARSPGGITGSHEVLRR